MNKHTSTPWSSWNDHVIIPAAHAGRKIGGSTNNKEDREDFAHEICRISRNSNHYTADEASANAAFIVKACNSHDALVEALKLAKIGIECAAEKARDYDDDSWIANVLALDTINAALIASEAP